MTTASPSAESDSVWGKRLGFGAKPVLMVIDLTRAFTEPHRPLGADADDVVAASNRLIDCAHEAGVPVIFTAVVYESPDLSDAGLWGRKIGGQSDLRAGGDGVTLDPRLNHRDGDTMFHKKYASCFFGTDLASRLTAQGCDTVVIAGLTTSGCIRATAVDAIQSGFRPIVVRQAVGDRWEDAHVQSLRDLENKYADVVDLEEALHELAARPQRA